MGISQLRVGLLETNPDNLYLYAQTCKFLGIQTIVGFGQKHLFIQAADNREINAAIITRSAWFDQRIGQSVIQIRDDLNRLNFFNPFICLVACDYNEPQWLPHEQIGILPIPYEISQLGHLFSKIVSEGLEVKR